MTTRLDILKTFMASGQPLAPLTQLLDIQLVAAEQGTARLEYNISERHANTMGTVHGGMLCILADTAMGVAFFTLLEDQESLTTLELKINYLKPIWKGKLIATAKVVKRGKTTGLVECDILDENDQLIARSSSTFMAISGNQALNRTALKKTE